MEVHLLAAGDAATLREQAKEAVTEGAAAVFITESSLGDPLVLAAGLAAAVPDVRLGARMTFSARSRHPAMLAREVTSLDLVCGGRSAVCFTPPFADTLAEAITLCRALWEVGEVVSEGPHFPVRAGRNRARPLSQGETGPIVVIDLTGGETLPGALDGLIDLVLRPTARPAVCVMERP